MANRALVVPLIERYFAKDGSLMKRGQVGIDHIVKDWAGGGTTCGYLPHWLWWRMGCQDAKLLARFEPDTPFRYKNGLQINQVYAHSEFTNLSAAGIKTVHDEKFVNRDIFPKRGDAIIIQGAPFANGAQSTHIFVILDEGTWTSNTKGSWRVAETGQTDNGGHIATHAVEYKGGKWMVGARWMLGWLDIDKITFSQPRPELDYLSRFAGDATPTSVTDLIGIWKITSNSSVWYYFFYKGFRIFYSESASPTLLAEGGYWLPRGGSGFNIHWDGGSDESITLTSKTAATGSAGSVAWTAKKVSSNATTMGNFHSNLGTSL